MKIFYYKNEIYKNDNIKNFGEVCRTDLRDVYPLARTSEEIEDLRRRKRKFEGRCGGLMWMYRWGGDFLEILGSGNF